MPLYLTEQELVKLQTNRASKAAQPKAKAPRVREPATGLTTLLLAGWNVSYNAAMQIRLWRGETTTRWHDDERACCDEAKGLA